LFRGAEARLGGAAAVLIADFIADFKALFMFFEKKPTMFPSLGDENSTDCLRPCPQRQGDSLALNLRGPAY
jgi:hypothetical protein